MQIDKNRPDEEVHAEAIGYRLLRVHQISGTPMSSQIFSTLAISLLTVCLFLSGCAGTHNPNGDGYDEPVMPGKTSLLNLTGNPTTGGAAEVYFSASSRVEMLVTFRDRLVAVEVDGKLLPGAEKGNKLKYSTGYQAIALSPGVHSITYCHVTRSALATGASICGWTVRDYNFEPNARYMVGEGVSVNHSMIGSSTVQTLRVQTSIVRIK